MILSLNYLDNAHPCEPCASSTRFFVAYPEFKLYYSSEHSPLSVSEYEHGSCSPTTTCERLLVLVE